MSLEKLPEPLGNLIFPFAAELKSTFGSELVSVMVYGGIARGAYYDGKSDINLLIVVESFNQKIYQVIGQRLRELRRKIPLDPMVVSRDSLKRTVHCFALKFMSIDRHHILIEGEDVLNDFSDDLQHLRFLVEQELRNLRLRSLRTYLLLAHDDEKLTVAAFRFYTKLMHALSNLLRVEGASLPDKLDERFGIMEKHFGISAAGLHIMHSYKAGTANRRVSAEEFLSLIEIIHNVLRWLTNKWKLAT